MATFTITTNSNFDALTSKGGGDTYNINGATLTIDGDVRYDNNCTTTTGPFRNITCSSSLGGDLVIDATNVWLIPYNTGSGNFSKGQTVTQGGVTGILLGTWSAINAAPTAVGAGIPASGFLKVKQVSGGAFAAGALTISGGSMAAAATGAQVQGWIDIVGDETYTLTASRLNNVTFTGAMFSLGTTNGSAGQVLNLPSSGVANYFIPGVWIEATAGAKDWEWYPSLSTTALGGFQTTSQGTASFNKCVELRDGTVRIGSDGSNNIGYVPTSGREVVIGNIIYQNTTSANRATNVVPNSTMGSRYEFNFTGGPAVAIDHCMFAWYVNVDRAYTFNMTYCSWFDAASIIQTLSPVIDHCGNGIYSILDTLALNINSCNGATLTNSTIGRAGTLAASDYSLQCSYSSNMTVTSNIIRQYVPRTVASVYSLFLLGLVDANLSSNTITAGLATQSVFTSTLSNTISIDREVGTTDTSNAMTVCSFQNKTSSVIVDGWSFGGTNLHPYTSLIAGTNCANISIRNIGTRAAPLSLGSANATGAAITTTSNCSNYRIQRCYFANSRTTSITANVTDLNCIWEDSGDTTLASYSLRGQNIIERKSFCSALPTAATPMGLDALWRDGFISDTVGHVQLVFNEPVNKLTNPFYEVNAGTVKFNGAGGVLLNNVGDSATWSMDTWLRISHGNFKNATPTLTGGTWANYTMEYRIVTTPNTAFSGAWKSMTAGNLSGEVWDASIGFRIQVKITCATANTEVLTFLNILTDTTAANIDDYQYDLDWAKATITAPNLANGSRVQIYNVTKAVEIGNGLAGASGYSLEQYIPNANLEVGDTVRLRATYQSGTSYKKELEALGVMGATSLNFIDTQEDWTELNTFAIDGSAVTEYSADYPNIQVDIDDLDGATTKANFLAWWGYNLTTEDGIRNYFGGIYTEDAVNFRVNTSILDLQFDNVGALDVRFTDTGVRIYRDDGGSIIATGSNSIIFDSGKVYLTDGTAIHNMTKLIPGLF